MSVVLTVLAAVFYALGWAAGKVSLLAGWCWSALSVGWDEARTPAAPELDPAALPIRPGASGR